MKRAENSTCSNAQVPEDRDGDLSSFPYEVRMGNMIDKILNKTGTSCAAFNGWLLFLMVLYATTKSG